MAYVPSDRPNVAPGKTFDRIITENGTGKGYGNGGFSDLTSPSGGVWSLTKKVGGRYTYNWWPHPIDWLFVHITGGSISKTVSSGFNEISQTLVNLSNGRGDSAHAVFNYRGAGYLLKPASRTEPDPNRPSYIAYHYLVAPNGHIYKTRSDGDIGNHISKAGTNGIGLGVCVIGNYFKEGYDGATRNILPPATQLNSLKWLLLTLMVGYQVTADRVVGHREVIRGGKRCPSTPIIEFLNQFRGELLQSGVKSELRYNTANSYIPKDNRGNPISDLAHYYANILAPSESKVLTSKEYAISTLQRRLVILDEERNIKESANYRVWSDNIPPLYWTRDQEVLLGLIDASRFKSASLAKLDPLLRFIYEHGDNIIGLASEYGLHPRGLLLLSAALTDYGVDTPIAVDESGKSVNTNNIFKIPYEFYEEPPLNAWAKVGNRRPYDVFTEDQAAIIDGDRGRKVKRRLMSYKTPKQCIEDFCRLVSQHKRFVPVKTNISVPAEAAYYLANIEEMKQLIKLILGDDPQPGAEGTDITGKDKPDITELFSLKVANELKELNDLYNGPSLKDPDHPDYSPNFAPKVRRILGGIIIQCPLVHAETKEPLALYSPPTKTPSGTI